MAFKKGVSGNPAGRKHTMFQNHRDFAELLLEQYKPSEIIEIAGDFKKLDKMSSFKAMIMVQLANALDARNKSDNAQERERLLDRIIGKPVNRTELTGKDGEKLEFNLAVRLEKAQQALDSQPVITDAQFEPVLNAIAAPPDSE